MNEIPSKRGEILKTITLKNEKVVGNLCCYDVLLNEKQQTVFIACVSTGEICINENTTFKIITKHPRTPREIFLIGEDCFVVADESGVFNVYSLDDTVSIVSKKRVFELVDKRCEVFLEKLSPNTFLFQRRFNTRFSPFARGSDLQIVVFQSGKILQRSLDVTKTEVEFIKNVTLLKDNPDYFECEISTYEKRVQQHVGNIATRYARDTPSFEWKTKKVHINWKTGKTQQIQSSDPYEVRQITEVEKIVNSPNYIGSSDNLLFTHTNSELQVFDTNSPRTGTSPCLSITFGPNWTGKIMESPSRSILTKSLYINTNEALFEFRVDENSRRVNLYTADQPTYEVSEYAKKNKDSVGEAFVLCMEVIEELGIVVVCKLFGTGSTVDFMDASTGKLISSVGILEKKVFSVLYLPRYQKYVCVCQKPRQRIQYHYNYNQQQENHVTAVLICSRTYKIERSSTVAHANLPTYHVNRLSYNEIRLIPFHTEDTSDGPQFVVITTDETGWYNRSKTYLLNWMNLYNDARRTITSISAEPGSVSVFSSFHLDSNNIAYWSVFGGLARAKIEKPGPPTNNFRNRYRFVPRLDEQMIKIPSIPEEDKKKYAIYNTEVRNICSTKNGQNLIILVHEKTKIVLKKPEERHVIYVMNKENQEFTRFIEGASRISSLSVANFVTLPKLVQISKSLFLYLNRVSVEVLDLRAGSFSVWIHGLPEHPWVCADAKRRKLFLFSDVRETKGDFVRDLQCWEYSLEEGDVYKNERIDFVKEMEDMGDFFALKFYNCEIQLSKTWMIL